MVRASGLAYLLRTSRELGMPYLKSCLVEGDAELAFALTTPAAHLMDLGGSVVDALSIARHEDWMNTLVLKPEGSGVLMLLLAHFDRGQSKQFELDTISTHLSHFSKIFLILVILLSFPFVLRCFRKVPGPSQTALKVPGPCETVLWWSDAATGRSQDPPRLP